MENKIVLRSAEMNEILEQPPKWIIRYGIGIIFSILILIAVVCNQIKSPQIIYADVAILSDFSIIYISPDQINKVKFGQEILIKLYDFPYMEYGILKSKIDSNSLITFDIKKTKMYIISIPFCHKQLTNSGIHISPNKEIYGKAEIVVEELYLIDKLVKPTKKMFKK